MCKNAVAICLPYESSDVVLRTYPAHMQHYYWLCQVQKGYDWLVEDADAGILRTVEAMQVQFHISSRAAF
jgi:hypothetical protein